MVMDSTSLMVYGGKCYVISSYSHAWRDVGHALIFSFTDKGKLKSCLRPCIYSVTIKWRNALLTLTHYGYCQGDQLSRLAWCRGVSGRPMQTPGQSLANWGGCSLYLQIKWTCPWTNKHIGKMLSTLGCLYVEFSEEETKVQMGKGEKK